MVSITPVTGVLAEFAAGPLLVDLTPDVADQARRTLVDTIGVGMAGRHTQVAHIVRQVAKAQMGRPEAVYWGERVGADAETAAMVNGATAHALDFDDVTESARAHLGAVIWPAILAAGEAVGCDGQRLLEAYIVGMRVAVALADGMNVEAHYARGWHATSSIGTLAAACAVARVWALDATTIRHALGIAASMAGGSRQNFGTMMKPMHAGLAARSGVFAAKLAAAGMRADEAMLEGPLGYFALFDGRDRLHQVESSLIQPWLPEKLGVSMKRYAVCYNLHRICDAISVILGTVELTPLDIARVVATIEPNGCAPLSRNLPRSPLEAKFSAEYVIASLVAGQPLGPTDFDGPTLAMPAVQQVMRKVELHESPVPPIGPKDWCEGYAVVVVYTNRGGEHWARVDYPKGHWGAPFTRAELSKKFAANLTIGGAGSVAYEVEQELWGFAELERFSGFRALNDLHLAMVKGGQPAESEFVWRSVRFDMSRLSSKPEQGV